VVEREASGDFDYLWDDPAEDDGLIGHDQDFDAHPADEADLSKDPGDDLWDEPDDSFWDNRPDVADEHRFGAFDGFNAFDNDTWTFTPAPVPWYRTKPAMAAIVATSAAAIAIVVAGVLLVFRAPSDTGTAVPSSVTPTAPTSAAPVPVASSEPPPPAPPPPPPPETASRVNTAPRYEAPRAPRPAKGPEINVTRSPISVAPQPRSPR
jgi:hypothetical protein